MQPDQSTQVRQSIAHALRSLRCLARDLRMQEEQLSGGQYGSLPDVSHSIETGLHSVSRTLHALQKTTGSADFAELNRQLDTHPALGPSWQKLLLQIKGCEAANQHNGMLLQTRSRQVREALNRIAGDNASTVYERSGHTGSSLRGSSLICTS